jgi:hypothetical protein
VTPYNGLPVGPVLAIGDPLVGRVPTWHPAYDDPTYRALVVERGVPGTSIGAGPVVVGETL